MPEPRYVSRHLTPSLIISLIALLVATSTGAYAVATLGAGDVRTRHIANGAVTTKKLDNRTSSSVPQGPRVFLPDPSSTTS
jgi:hypothetical protein